MTYWIYQDANQRWRWKLTDDKGVTIAGSMAYPDEATCREGIWLTKNSTMAQVKQQAPATPTKGS